MSRSSSADISQYGNGSLVEYRKHAITAAKDLGYSPECIARLRKAKSEVIIARIMFDERHRMFDEEEN